MTLMHHTHASKYPEVVELVSFLVVAFQFRRTVFHHADVPVSAINSRTELQSYVITHRERRCKMY